MMILNVDSFHLEPPGSRLPLHLASVTHALTLQHVVDRVNLICAQQNLNMPTRTASDLVLLATQVGPYFGTFLSRAN